MYFILFLLLHILFRNDNIFVTFDLNTNRHNDNFKRTIFSALKIPFFFLLSPKTSDEYDGIPVPDDRIRFVPDQHLRAVISNIYNSKRVQ